MSSATGTNGQVYMVWTLALDAFEPGTSLLQLRLLSRSASSPTMGTGAAMNDVKDVLVDPANDLLFVLDHIGHELLAIDMVTGNRSLISSSNRGAGPALDTLLSLALHPDGRHVFVLQRSSEIVSVDIQSGDRMLVADATHGSGPVFRSGFDIASADGRVLLFDNDLGCLGLDAESGARAVLVAVIAPSRKEPARDDPGRSAVRMMRAARSVRYRPRP